jgi:hypothetical protein
MCRLPSLSLPHLSSSSSLPPSFPVESPFSGRPAALLLHRKPASQPAKEQKREPTLLEFRAAGEGIIGAGRQQKKKKKLKLLKGHLGNLKHFFFADDQNPRNYRDLLLNESMCESFSTNFGAILWPFSTPDFSSFFQQLLLSNNFKTNMPMRVGTKNFFLEKILIRKNLLLGKN